MSVAVPVFVHAGELRRVAFDVGGFPTIVHWKGGTHPFNADKVEGRKESFVASQVKIPDSDDPKIMFKWR